ncbi:MAG: universal stress protein, partial [Gammaproteobacteria bacterium]
CQMHASDLLEGSMGDAITIESQSVSEAKKNLDEFIKNHVSNGISVSTSISTGDPHNEINQAAKELNADMIVMGTHGRTGLSHLVMGSVAENVLRHATVPVMSIRHA